MDKFFAILLMCILSLPVIAIEGQEVELAPVNEETLEVIPTEEAKELNSPVSFEQNKIPAPTQNLNGQFKEPVSKKKLLKKFVIAMLCVAGTSVFLYGALSIYNKIRNGLDVEKTEPLEGEQTLEAPSDLTEAVKSFIEKTHWEN